MKVLISDGKDTKKSRYSKYYGEIVAWMGIISVHKGGGSSIVLLANTPRPMPVRLLQPKAYRGRQRNVTSATLSAGIMWPAASETAITGRFVPVRCLQSHK